MASDGDRAGEGGHATVTLVREDGSTVPVRVAPGETILEAAEGAGLDLRYGCREGECASCTARLLDGEVAHAGDPGALDDGRREAGFVLPCVARPVGDCRIAVGRSVLGEAFPTLWGSGDGDESR